ncbi:unnamed protein product [Cylicocyclus nassatus]|uniref:Uncharacterized protein n=1 Tax=Cylicocyclus nassatus TaxID=53992 RepID=A0AA36HB15_CYLNA|nr:unnamed protein product [Cylicocyclus nassatus]
MQLLHLNLLFWWQTSDLRFILRKSASLTEIGFQSKPTVLLLTPDDCDEHSEVTIARIVVGGRFVRTSTRAVMSLNERQFQSMRVFNNHPRKGQSEALRTSATPPELPNFWTLEESCHFLGEYTHLFHLFPM